MKIIDETTGFRIDELPEIFEHPMEKDKQFPDSECPYCYIEALRRHIAALESELESELSLWEEALGKNKVVNCAFARSKDQVGPLIDFTAHGVILNLDGYSIAPLNVDQKKLNYDCRSVRRANQRLEAENKDLEAQLAELRGNIEAAALAKLPVVDGWVKVPVWFVEALKD